MDEKREITHAKIMQTLGKAMLDTAFQEKLFKNPGEVGKKLGLNDSGIELIKKMDKNAFTEFTRNLDAKLSKDAAIIIFCASY
jgi:hypothetical protein